MNRILAVMSVFLAFALPCLAQATDRIELTPASNADWVAGGPPGGEVCSIAQGGRNSDVIYVSTASGIFKSTNSGDSWKLASSGLPRLEGLCYGVRIDPNRPETLFAEIFGNIYKTTDEGASWAPVNPGATESVLLAVDPTNAGRLYIESGGKILKSLDGGASWNPVRAAGLPPHDLDETLVLDHSNPNTLYIGIDVGIFKSTDAGETWSSADTGYSERVDVLVMDPTNPAILYATTNDGVFQSSTGGASWKILSDSLPRGVESLVVDPSNPATLYAATDTEIFVRRTAGNWQRITPDIHGILIRSIAVDSRDSSTLFACTPAGLFRSKDAGKTWSLSNSGLASQGVAQLAVLGTNGGTVFAVGAMNTLFKSADYGDHWNTVTGLPPGKIFAITPDSAHGRMIFAMVDDSIYQNRDGATWYKVRIDSSSTVTSLPALDFSKPGAIRAYFRDRMLYSLDDGATWSLFEPRFPIFQVPPSLWIDPHNSQTIFAASLATGLYRSRDGGETWDKASGAPPALGFTLFLDPNQAGMMYMLTHEGSFPSGAYRSTDGGFHWESMDLGADIGDVEYLAMVPSKQTVLFAEVRDDDTDSFPFPRTLLKSFDQGASWTNASSGLPSTAGLGPIAAAPGDGMVLYMGVAGAGVFKSTDGGEHWHPTGAR